ERGRRGSRDLASEKLVRGDEAKRGRYNHHPEARRALASQCVAGQRKQERQTRWLVGLRMPGDPIDAGADEGAGGVREEDVVRNAGSVGTEDELEHAQGKEHRDDKGVFHRERTVGRVVTIHAARSLGLAPARRANGDRPPHWWAPPRKSVPFGSC